MIDEVVRHFGAGSVQRHLVGQRLERIFKLAISTRQVARFIVFGSFVTAKADPGNVDIFMLMEGSSDSDQVGGEAAIVLDHQAAQNVLGTSVCSGSGESLQLAESLKHSGTGGSNATTHGGA